MPSDLVEQLKSSTGSLKKLPEPAVFAAYCKFLESGRFPYTDDVVQEIRAEHSVPEDLEKKLEREVYLSGCLNRVNQLGEEARRYRAEGYLPITWLRPKGKMSVELTDGVKYRVVNANGRDWALLPPLKRTNGISLNGLVGQHRAYENAMACGRDRMNSPHVRMAKWDLGTAPVDPMLGQLLDVSELSSSIVDAMRKFFHSDKSVEEWQEYSRRSVRFNDDLPDCDKMSENFATQLVGEGLRNVVVVRADDAPVSLSGQHYWTRIKTDAGFLNVDWTARQFYNLEYPDDANHADLPSPMIWIGDGPKHPVLDFQTEQIIQFGQQTSIVESQSVAPTTGPLTLW